MACKGCEERREQIKVLYDQAKQQLRYAIDLLKANRTKQSVDSANKPGDGTSNNGNHTE